MHTANPVRIFAPGHLDTKGCSVLEFTAIGSTSESVSLTVLTGEIVINLGQPLDFLAVGVDPERNRVAVGLIGGTELSSGLRKRFLEF